MVFSNRNTDQRHIANSFLQYKPKQARFCNDVCSPPQGQAGSALPEDERAWLFLGTAISRTGSGRDKTFAAPDTSDGFHQNFINFILVYKAIHSMLEGALDQIGVNLHRNDQHSSPNPMSAEE